MSGIFGGILGVLLLAFGLLTGILALAREVQLMYRPAAVESRRLFWVFVRIAFVMSVGWLWWNEHARVESETTERLRTQTSLKVEAAKHDSCETSLRLAQDALNVNRGSTEARSAQIEHQ
jgi:hypothetical protein